MNQIDYSARVAELEADVHAMMAVLVTIVVALAGYALWRKLVNFVHR